MDGTGCWRDNVFVERLWKSIKYEEVYLHAYETVSAAHQGLARYLVFYNQHRPHRALDGKTPEQVYCDNLTMRLSAASSDHREAPLKKWTMLSNQTGPLLMRCMPNTIRTSRRESARQAGICLVRRCLPGWTFRQCG